jgi:hypothetical protein
MAALKYQVCGKQSIFMAGDFFLKRWAQLIGMQHNFWDLNLVE